MEGAVRVAARRPIKRAAVRQARSPILWAIAPVQRERWPLQDLRVARRPQQPRVSLSPAVVTMCPSPDETTSLLGRTAKQNASESVWVTAKRKTFERSDNPTGTHTTTTSDCYSTFHTFDDGTTCEQRHFEQPHRPAKLDFASIPADLQPAFRSPTEVATRCARLSSTTTVETTLPCEPHTNETVTKVITRWQKTAERDSHPGDEVFLAASDSSLNLSKQQTASGMSEQPAQADLQKSPAKEHKPLVVGRTKPQSNAMESPNDKAVNEAIEKNVETNSGAAAPADGVPAAPKQKKEKAPKQPKPPKAAPPTAPLSPALIDLRVGHILRAINHPNADSLYVSTIAMGDPEGTEHTQVDEATGKVVRTVCSGLNGLVPLAEMQDRKVVVVANLKPVNMRSIKSAAMVLAASPPAEEGADPHAADRVVELVSPPEGAEAGDPVFFDGWEYGEGKGPEKQLNPKKKQWEAIQPGFYTSDDLVVGFDAGKSEVEGDQKGDLVVKDKGKCTVKTLKGAVVR